MLLPERIGALSHDPKPARYEKQIADLQGIIAGKDGPGGFRFTINGKDGDEWFGLQRKEFYEKIGIDIERTEQRRGMKM